MYSIIELWVYNGGGNIVKSVLKSVVHGPGAVEITNVHKADARKVGGMVVERGSLIKLGQDWGQRYWMWKYTRWRVCESKSMRERVRNLFIWSGKFMGDEFCLHGILFKIEDVEMNRCIIRIHNTHMNIWSKLRVCACVWMCVCMCMCMSHFLNMFVNCSVSFLFPKILLWNKRIYIHTWIRFRNI